MLYRDPISATDRSPRRPLIWLAMALAVLSVPAYLYGPRLYYRYSDDPMARMERRAAGVLKLYAEGASPDVLVKQVDESLTVLGILEKDYAAEPLMQYYFGFFEFFEILVRTDPTAGTLVQLAGRGYLPVSRDVGVPRKRSLSALGRRVSVRMRRAVALKPDFGREPVAHLALLYGDLFYTARTDRVLQEHLARIQRQALPVELHGAYDWMALLLDVVAGDGARLEKRLAQKKGGLLVESGDAALLSCYAAFQAARYLDALRLARGLQGNPELFRQVEALRMEAEVFWKQRGGRAARPYFEQALRKAGGNDPFLAGRIRQITEP